MIKDILQDVVSELRFTLDQLDEQQLQNLKTAIMHADRIFVAGAGRSLLMIRGLAMRLMHMGYTSYVVGETVTPAIQKGDLLIIASGSGSTGSLVVMAEKCKQIGADLALITTRAESPIGQLSDIIVQVHAASTKVAQDHQAKTIQPGSNTFEQSVLLIGDSLIIDLIKDTDLAQNNRILMSRHANLE